MKKLPIHMSGLKILLVPRLLHFKIFHFQLLDIIVSFGLDRFVPMIADQVAISIEAEFLRGSNDTSAAAVKISADALSNADPASLQVSADFGAEQ